MVKLGVSRRPGALLSFSCSFYKPKPLQLWYLNMNEASVSVLAGASDIQIVNSKVYAATTVSRMIIVERFW